MGERRGLGDRPAAVRPDQRWDFPGDLAGQAIAAGLVDQVRVPVVFGTGVRYFGDYAGSPLLLENPPVVQGDRVTHLRYHLPRP